MLWCRHIVLMFLGSSGVGLVLAFPWLMRTLPALGVAVALFFSQLCHQDAARSFALTGTMLPVCMRCLALYIGGFSGIAMFPLLRRCLLRGQTLIRILVTSAVLMMLDAVLDLVGIWRNTPFSRSVTGALFGVVCGLLVSFATQQPCGQGLLTRCRTSR